MSEREGAAEGTVDGDDVGPKLGDFVGLFVTGDADGTIEGDAVGPELGLLVTGAAEGAIDGDDVGPELGDFVGLAEGPAVGAGLGTDFVKT